VARLLRQKSAIVVSFGSCACFGGIPGLANVTNKKDLTDYVYNQTFSSVNPEHTRPLTKWQGPEGELELPMMYDTVLTLDDVIDVDYFMPGCPPTTDQINAFLDIVTKHLTEGAPLPPKGAVLASQKTLCDECGRTKEVTTIDRINMPYDIEIDPKKCMIEQGVICLGPATRAGCGAKCLQANQPCRGCMGPTAAVLDQGGSMLSALASVFKTADNETQMSEDEILQLMTQIKDPLGTFYAFTMPKSIIKRKVKEKKAGVKQ
jgi:F420-non-reducing hydrogenase small subunit